MNTLEIFNFDLNKVKSDLPKNVYATEILNIENNEVFKIAIQHNGYCPTICSDHDQSNFSEYLCNLQAYLIQAYFKTNKRKKPKSYSTLSEIVTNSRGELYHYAYSID